MFDTSNYPNNMIHDGEVSKRSHGAYKTRGALEKETSNENGPVLPSDAKSKAGAESTNNTGLVTAVAHVAVPNWANLALMASLIFGGCCTNVSSTIVELYIRKECN